MVHFARFLGLGMLPAFLFLSFSNSPQAMTSNSVELVTLGAGCFWCVEAVFESIPGVISGVSGYSGGHIKNPGYREVCTGRTGHAEVVQVTFDPSEVSLGTILDVFFATHDPTTLNRQGADVGTQYRSAIYWHSESQVAEIERAVERASKRWTEAIVTEVAPFEVFYPAEDYHQAYYELNGEAPYCRAVIAPKMAKFRQEFGAKLNLK
jgi:peptide-methionine (S)-S-oxide reductase